MLSKTEVVWRHLLQRSTEGVYRHRSVTAVADELGFAISTVHKALGAPAEMGALTISPSGGVRLLDPFRVAVLWAGRRQFDRDVTATWVTEAPAPEIERRIAVPGAVLGGHGAVVARLSRNVVSDYPTVIVYADDPCRVRDMVPETACGATTLIVAEPDPLLSRYGNVTPLHQAWVDLFTRPGWQAARFVEALTSLWVTTDAA